MSAIQGALHQARGVEADRVAHGKDAQNNDELAALVRTELRKERDCEKVDRIRLVSADDTWGVSSFNAEDAAASHEEVGDALERILPALQAKYSLAG